MTFTITINPYIALVVVIALAIVYAIKSGYDHSKHEINTKAQQGTRI